MSHEHEKSADFRAKRTSPALPVRDTDADVNPINPYQAPAYHSDDVDAHTRGTKADPGAPFWLTAAAFMALGFLAVGLAGGLALPLPFALIGATVRASIMFARQRDSAYGQSPAVLLLITSTFVTLLLMFCSAIAFVTICTSGVFFVGAQASSLNVGIWTIVSSLVALFAFAFMFIRSLKWGV